MIRRKRIGSRHRETAGRDELGVAFLCDIGFNLSLYIAGLTFEHARGAHCNFAELGILMGSMLSEIVGVLVLTWNPDQS